MSRMQGTSGGKGSVAAKGSGTKSTANQPVSAPEASENKTAHGPDNNKRLAALEADVARLVEKLTTVAGFDLVADENPIALAGNIVEGFAKYQRDGGELHELLLKRAGFDFGEGETCFGAAARVIADLDAKAEEASPGELAAIKRAEEAEANYLAASAQLGEIHELLLSNERFESGPEGEELPEAVQRFIAAILTGEAAGSDIGQDPGAEQLERLVAGQVESFSGLPSAAAFALMFADGDAVIDVPPRSVSREELTREGERAIYDRRLPFPPGGPSHNITAVWLVAFDPRDKEGIGDVVAARCEIPGGLRVGGGAQAAIPAGHLIF